jgi:tetratricopeptide (TPR) repeat protein
LEICRHTDDQAGEGAACAALASSFKAQNDLAQSIKYLEKCHEIASKSKQLLPEAGACQQLGQAYADQGMHDKAVIYYEKAYEIARQLGDRKLINDSRIQLGMSKGNLQIGNYMNVVNTDLPALLRWKTRRVGSFATSTPVVDSSKK